jgi:diacylglycerol kinase (ATP)
MIIKRLWSATLYSWAGFNSAWQNQWAFRLELYLTPFIALAAVFIASEPWQFCVLLACWLLVIVTELLNSAIEMVVDRISLERHPLSRQAKDLGSAAVFAACVLTTVVWLGFLWTALFG